MAEAERDTPPDVEGADEQPTSAGGPGHTTNGAMGVFRTLLQIGTVIGDIHVHPPRRPVVIAALAAVCLALAAILALVLIGSARRVSEASAPSTAPSATTAGGGDAPAGTSPPPSPPVRPEEVHEVVVPVSGDPVAVADGLRIAVRTAGFTVISDDEVTCGGVAHGGGGRTCTATAGGSSGADTLGVIDFSVLTPALTCVVSSVHLDESAVVVEPGGRWTRVVLLDIGLAEQDRQALPVTFEVSRGRGAPAPQSPKVCVPG